MIKDDCQLFHIVELSENLKDIIKRQLILICHGKRQVKERESFHTYKRTLSLFLSRLKDKNKNYQKGIMGELLFHILFFEYNNGYRAASPFFNLEEKSIKKGFDVIIVEEESNQLWLSEVKSGGFEKNNSSNQKIRKLIHSSKNDLKSRINENSSNIWLSAIYGVSHTLVEEDKIKLINETLESTFSDTEQKIDQSQNHCVILSSNLFASLEDITNLENLTDLYNSILKENSFKKIKIIAIQKSTFEELVHFFESEVENG